MKKRGSADKLAKMAVMAALSVVLLLLIRIPFPPAPFLVYDPADIPIYIAAFAFGPVSILIAFVVCFIQAFILGGDGIYGFLMHFIATGAFALLVGRMYQRNKTRKTAVISLIVGALLITAIMCAMNLVVTPVFMGVPRSVVAKMIVPTIIPFNLLKTGINGVVTFLVYKRVSRFLHGEIRTGEAKANKEI